MIFATILLIGIPLRVEAQINDPSAIEQANLDLAIRNFQSMIHDLQAKSGYPQENIQSYNAILTNLQNLNNAHKIKSVPGLLSGSTSYSENGVSQEHPVAAYCPTGGYTQVGGVPCPDDSIIVDSSFLNPNNGVALNETNPVDWGKKWNLTSILIHEKQHEIYVKEALNETQSQGWWKSADQRTKNQHIVTDITRALNADNHKRVYQVQKLALKDLIKLLDDQIKRSHSAAEKRDLNTKKTEINRFLVILKRAEQSHFGGGGLAKFESCGWPNDFHDGDVALIMTSPSVWERLDMQVQNNMIVNQTITQTQWNGEYDLFSPVTDNPSLFITTSEQTLFNLSVLDDTCEYYKELMQNGDIQYSTSLPSEFTITDNTVPVTLEDLNNQCQTNYGDGAYYDSAQYVCLPPSGDWTNPGTAYLTLQCQTNYGTGAYYDATQNVCLPPSGDWTNPGTAYLTLQCAENYGEGVYYDPSQKICLPPSGSWVTSTSVSSTSINETQTAQTMTCPDGQTLDSTTNKCINTESIPKQVTISNDALILLYQTSKQYEKATSSLLALNDNQENALHRLTESSWYKNSADTKNAVHAQVVDLMTEKQSIDKKNIQDVSDWMKKISDNIKEYAQKQGVDPSILEQIDSTTQYEDNSRNALPVVGLRQSADDANINVNAANNEKMTLDNNKEIAGSGLLGFILGKDSVVEQFRFLTKDGIFRDDPSLVQMAETVLKEHHDELSKNEIEFINSYLEPFVSPVSSNENLFDQIEKYINSLNGKEQKETDSILNQISDSGMGELSPIEKTAPQFLSKHGTYEPSANSNSQSELYDVFVTWVLKSQSGVEYKSAHMIATNHQTGSIGILDLPIVDGVIQFNVPAVEPGTYDFKLTKIDGLPSPADNMIEIVIPNRPIGNVTPPSPIPTSQVPQTPPITEIPLGFSVPSQVVQEATSSSGAIVSFTTPFSSPPGPTQSIICNPSSGSQFPLGNTVVKCIETDLSNSKTLEKSFTVTVQDTTGPAISPFNPHNDTPDDSGAVVYFTTEAIDLVDGSVPVHCDHESGTKFPIGSTIVACTADDSKGNHSERKFSVNITITKSP
jgi:hypothetical protein